MSEEEFDEFQQEIIEDGQRRESRCLPSDFQDHDPNVRHQKAIIVNLYFEYGGNWQKVLRDNRAVSRRTLAIYWTDELFRAKIAALDPILTMEARGVVVEIMQEGQDEKTRLAAALRWLEQADGDSWDRGIRRQRIANKGSIANTFARAITDEEYLTTLAKDKLNRLPEAARKAILDAIREENRELETELRTGLPMGESGNPDEQIVVDITPVPEKVVAKEQIRIVDPNNPQASGLTDPFGD